MLSIAELKLSLAAFSVFARSLKGDEKGEAQLFLDKFFRALGHGGVQEAGATLEFRIAKKPGSAQLELLQGEAAKPRAGGKKFADLLWPGRVLIEMKQRGFHLEKAYDQLYGYWQLIVPNRPAYAILCNFDEFWIYDFNTQLFDPVDRVPLVTLADNLSPFNFLLPYPKKPIFDNNRVEVTQKAADRMAQLFRDIVFRGEDRARTQRFILQLLVAMVAEDIPLLPADLVTELLGECAEHGGNSYDLLGGLFRQMATQEPARGGRYRDVRYFNGGLFATVDPIELRQQESRTLYDSARFNDWSKVKPEIFGTLFQQSMETGQDGKGRDERHAFGAHFTSEFDIDKVVGPTIVRPWTRRIEGAGRSLTKLREVLRDLRLFRVLDPACGSGNFLFVAYRQIKRLERTLLLALRDAGENPDRLASGILLTNFFGIDVLPFAVELAKVTLMLAKELELREADKFAAADGLLLKEEALPLDNLDQQIICADSLFTEWPKAEAIIGNPPFQSKNKIVEAFGRDYVTKIRKAYPGIPGRSDFCVYWFRKAHDSLQPGQRAGLVGTNTIRQNYSREGGMDYIVANGGTILEAVSNQVWSGDAAVHVSIANWIKGDQAGEKKLMIQTGNAVDSPWVTHMLSSINSSLSPEINLAGAISLRANAESGACYQGQTHGHEGFLLEPAEVGRFLANSAAVVHPYLTADDMIANLGGIPSRYVIDLNRCNSVIDARQYPAAYEHVKTYVLPTVQANAESEFKSLGKASGPRQNHFNKWWKFWRGRGELIEAISYIPRYIACGQVTKRPIFSFVTNEIRPNAALIVFPLADDYSFGILQSGIHWDWFTAKCSTLTERFRYTSDTVFDTFPWPQTPTKKQIVDVAAAAVALRGLRREVMTKLGYSLRALYRTLEEPGANPLRDAHARLDAAVRAAYTMPKDADPLAFLLALNLELAAKEKAGEPITPPGLPLPAAERTAFITEDCVRAREP